MNFFTVGLAVLCRPSFTHANIIRRRQLSRLLTRAALRCRVYLNRLNVTVIIVTLFHRRTRASYVYNGCLAWYNVVLTHGSTQA